jgi:hypothetical protein
MKYKGQKLEFNIQMFRLFSLQKRFEQPLFECLTEIEEGSDIEKSYFLLYTCVDIEDDFEEFCNNVTPVDMIPALQELYKELIPMFVTDKQEKTTSKKK